MKNIKDWINERQIMFLDDNSSYQKIINSTKSISKFDTLIKILTGCFMKLDKQILKLL